MLFDHFICETQTFHTKNCAIENDITEIENVGKNR